jgi:hypothetical protein
VKVREDRAALVSVAAAGALMELACCWVWLISPRLTSGYNPEFTSDFLDRFGLPLPRLGAAQLGHLEAGLVAMSVAYLACLVLLFRRSCEKGPAKWLIVGFSFVFHATFLAMPGMYSTDIFSYVMYGRIAGVIGQNPYSSPPSSFANEAFLNWVFPFWQGTPTVYGPLWTDLSALLSSATSTASALDQVLLYKLVIWLSALTNLALVWMLTGRATWLRGPRVACFALYAWNPIVLLELAGNAHNDALMVTLLLLSIVPLTGRSVLDRHWLAAMLIATASALTKNATAPVVAFYAAAGVRNWRTALTAGAAVVSLATLLWWPYLGSPDAIVTLTRPASGVLVLNSIPELIGQYVAEAGVPVESADTWSRAICAMAYLCVVCWELVRVRRLRTPVAALEASARALLLLPLLVLSWVWSWYFTWSIAVTAVLGIRTRLAQVVVAITAVAPPVFYAHQYLNQDMPTWPLVVYAAVPLLLVPIGAGYKLFLAREEVVAG